MESKKTRECRHCRTIQPINAFKQGWSEQCDECRDRRKKNFLKSQERRSD